VTLSIMILKMGLFAILSIITGGIKTLNIMKLSKMGLFKTPSIIGLFVTLSIMILCIMGLCAILSIMAFCIKALTIM
jgi:hypothetical protein